MTINETRLNLLKQEKEHLAQLSEIVNAINGYNESKNNLCVQQSQLLMDINDLGCVLARKDGVLFDAFTVAYIEKQKEADKCARAIMAIDQNMQYLESSRLYYVAELSNVQQALHSLGSPQDDNEMYSSPAYQQQFLTVEEDDMQRAYQALLLKKLQQKELERAENNDAMQKVYQTLLRNLNPVSPPKNIQEAEADAEAIKRAQQEAMRLDYLNKLQKKVEEEDRASFSKQVQEQKYYQMHLHQQNQLRLMALYQEQQAKIKEAEARDILKNANQFNQYDASEKEMQLQQQNFTLADDGGLHAQQLLGFTTNSNDNNSVPHVLFQPSQNKNTVYNLFALSYIEPKPNLVAYKQFLNYAKSHFHKERMKAMVLWNDLELRPGILAVLNQLNSDISLFAAAICSLFLMCKSDVNNALMEGIDSLDREKQIDIYQRLYVRLSRSHQLPITERKPIEEKLTLLKLSCLSSKKV